MTVPGLVSVVVCTAIVCAVLTGCSSPSGTPQTAAPDGGLTARQKRTAVHLAQSEVRRLARSVTNISATVGSASLPLEQSNSGHACTSGTVMNIRIIGTFNADVGGTPTAPGSPPEDSTITAEEVTADAETDDICLIGVRVGPVTPDHGATILLQK